VTRVLKIEEKNCLSFDSAKEYYDGVKIKPHILSLPLLGKGLKPTLKDYFLKHKSQPVIVFIEKEDEKLLKTIKKIVGSWPGGFCAVNNED